MKLNTIKSGLILLIIAGVTACAPSHPVGQSNFSDHAVSATPAAETAEPLMSTATPAAETAEPLMSTATPVRVSAVQGHSGQPAQTVPGSGQIIYDVESSGNAAPYGDTYRLNRFERPFLKDMTYVPDLDILSFSLSQDADWYYVSLKLNGKDPNNFIGIDYGVEIDLDADGFGDYMIWAHSPYSPTWATGTVQVFKDANHDTGGQSSVKADPPSNGDGYETLVFDGGAAQNDDPDLAWVRTTDSPKATIQFAFKRDLTGSSFMLGVISDAGIKDVSRADYSDHFTQADAGSPEKGSSDYPLKSLYAVDNTCWEAYGMSSTGFEPKVCPVIKQPTPTPGPNADPTHDSCYPLPPCPDYPGVCGCA